MANVYVVGENGATRPMNRVHCGDEDAELQSILENNHDLLPGDQFDPEDPCRWLLIKREMPVPDPNTGTDRWKIDFFFVDQSAIPTFVECKRFKDTRSRREIVGQMLEYAANGHYYWTKEEIRDFADESNSRNGNSLEKTFQALGANDDLALDAFFERIQNNLREGQLRIVFFLEESPMELRSVVDFLNKQMELSWVLLVEARQYTNGSTTIVVPTLFGYTEEARRAKRPVVIGASKGSRKKWDKDSFFADVTEKLPADQVQVLKTFYSESAAAGFEFSWGTGSIKGSFNIKDPMICPRSLVTAYSNGDLQLNLPWLRDSESAETARDRLKSLLADEGVFQLPAEYMSKWVTYPPSEWMPKATQLVRILKMVSAEARIETAKLS